MNNKMVMRTKFIVIVFCLLISKLLLAQDPHYSQFFAAPLTLNPALTGKFDGQMRLTFNQRTQWPSIPKAYVTTSAGVDFGIMKNKIPEGDILGVGFSGMSDASANGILKVNFGSVSVAYHKALDADGYNTIGAGFQGTFASMGLDVSKLEFEDALTQNGFQPGVSADIPNINRNKAYATINAGILYSGSTNGENNYYLGASLYHVNRPKVGFKDKNWNLASRFSVHAGGSIPISDVLDINPFVLYQNQNSASEILAGTALTYYLNTDAENPAKLFVGAWARIGDALIPYAGLEFNSLRIGASYDVNTSRLTPATSGRGGSEFSLIWIKKPAEYKGIPCPRF